MGLLISRCTIHAVVVRRGMAVWTAKRPITSLLDVRAALAELAGERPAGCGVAHTVLESDICPVKILTGLPPLSTARLREAVAIQASCFFVGNGMKRVTASAWLRDRRGALAAVADAALIDAIADGCREAGLRLARITPAAVVLAMALPDGRHIRVIGEDEESIEIAGRELVAIRRTVRANAAVPASDEEAQHLATLALAIRPALALTPPPHLVRDEFVTLVRAVRVTAVVAAASWSAAVAVFAQRTARVIADSDREMSVLQPALDRSAVMERDLGQTHGALRTMSDATGSQSSDVALLAAVTSALPDSAYLTSLSRSANGRVTLAGAAGASADVFSRLRETPGVRDPVMQGPVARNGTAGRAREHFVIVFWWRVSRDAP